MTHDADELPPDPDLDHADPDLRLLAGLGPVTLIDPDDGITTRDVLVLVPSMFRRAALGPEEAED